MRIPWPVWGRQRAGLALTAAFALASFVLLLGQPGLVSGHDVGLEVVRLVEYRAALAGQGYPRLAPDLYLGYGSPIFVFYPPLFLALATLADLGLDDLDVSIKAVTAGLGILSACFAHLLLRRHFRPPASAVGTAVWVLAPYKFTDLYTRNAFAEYTAMCLLPVLFHFALAASASPRPRRRDAIGLFVATALLALAHTLTLLITLPALALALAWGWLGTAERRTARPTVVALAVLAGLGTAAFSLVPASLHRHLIHADQLAVDRFAVDRNFTHPGALFFDSGLFYWQSPLPLLILLAAAYRALRDPAGFRRAPLAVLGAALAALALFMLTSASAPVWRAIPILALVQFPWRFLLLFSLGISWLAAYAADAIEPARRVLAALALGLTTAALAAVHGRQFAGAGRFDPGSITPERVLRAGLRSTILDEYFPRAADGMKPGRSERARALDETTPPGGEVDATRYERCGEFPAPAPVRFELLNFPYWHATVDGRPVPLDPARPTLEIAVPAGRHCAAVTLGYTPIQPAACLTSALSAVLFLGYLGWDSRRRSPPAFSGRDSP